ncbi:hypothetical protein [Brevibacillus laterosporus]|uniref:Ribosomal protein L7/L12 C-terminal domain-containing protein n=1 Tax=Brevibacillus laterosporus LMG 15441 TaxID=1042163 RepID=A0A075R495_BRELA|nr:hypothetical protein [Brevibacillus laterosporus]AIG26013.1 hypothetical protein BRLA_c016890 [Brevibacillus laterosporus LMG 15441]
MELTIIMVLVCIVLLLVEKVNRLQNQIKRMNVILQQIAAQVGVTNYSESIKPNNNVVLNHPINAKLHRLLAEGKQIEAIKEARIELGLSLIEAKEYVERL